MAKNELLPFADGEDANVLPTNQWEALTDILENGFQSGIARSEQVNRVLAQGAVASYVLGQLIVDQLNKDATLDKNVLYQNLILALQENAKDACLPLSGGTMTGTIKTTVEGVIEGSDDTKVARVSGGAGWNNGASIVVYGKNRSDNPGAFRIKANDGTNGNNAILFGKPDGTLTWGGNSLLTMPDYSAGVSISNNTVFTAPSDGFVVTCGRLSSKYSYLYINGVEVIASKGSDGGHTGDIFTVLVSKGDTVKVVYEYDFQKGTFYPLKGAN